MIRHLAFSALAAASIAAAASPALAHAHLEHSDPSAGAKGPAPTSIALGFSEGVVPGLSSISLADAAGHVMKLGKATNGSDATTLVVPVSEKLPPGVYVVTWRAVATDTHRTQGTFQFTVTP